MMPSKPASRTLRGFTLIEMLVALVIISMLVTLLTSALFFANRTSQIIDRESVLVRQRQIQSNQFRFVLKHCLPGSEKGAPVFSGSDKNLECFSAQTLEGTIQQRPLKVRWRIVEENTTRSQLLYNDESMGPEQWVKISDLPTQAVFRYWSDDRGNLEKWPPEASNRLWIPRAIAIEWPGKDIEQGSFWHVTLAATAYPAPGVTTLFGIPVQ